MKFKEWKETYFELYLKPRIKEHTYQIYDGIYHRHIETYFGELELKDISFNHINLFLCNLMKLKGKQSDRLKPTTINLIMTLLKQIIKEAYLEDLIDKDPTKRAKRIPEDKPKTIILRTKEQKRLVSYCLDKKDDSRYLGIILTLYTGLRIGELLALTWDKINLRSHLIEINTTAITLKDNDNKNHIVLTKPKTSSSIRQIPIPMALFLILQEEKNKTTSKYVINYKDNIIRTRS